MSDQLPPLHPEEWLARRLVNVAESDPRYEASWYGPYNALLSHYFPYQQQFLVKPQPRVRDLYVEHGKFSFSSVEAESSIAVDESLTAEADISMTSMGGLAMPQGSTCIPGFIVTKATESACHDNALLVVGIKPHEPGMPLVARTNAYQMNAYMRSLAKQMPEGSKLVGLLICGTGVTMSMIKAPDTWLVDDGIMYDINSANIRQLLLEIATDNWGY